MEAVYIFEKEDKVVDSKGSDKPFLTKKLQYRFVEN